MKKDFLFIVGILFFPVLEIFAQAAGTKWEKVFESAEQTVLADTSSIKQFENQISLLSVVNYKKPMLITSLNKEAASIKSQLLFNAASKKYTVIGTLYYDKNLKILGETSLPGFASGSETFSLPIEGNEMMSALFNKAVDYLKSGFTEIEKNDFSKNIEKADQTKKIKVEAPKPIVIDSSKAVDRVALYLNKRDSVQKVSSESAKSKNAKTSSSNEDQKNRKEVIQPSDVGNAASGSEINIKSTIFKEGNKYSFQISSWKNKTKAESEVKRLIKKGEPAFLAEGMVKREMWYRVRIGYFNSLEETEQYMNKRITR